MTPTPAPFSNVPTQDEIARRQKMAQALMGQAVDASPVEHWTQALARVVKGGVGGMWDNQARQGQQDRQSAVMKALSGDPSFSKLGLDMQGMLSNSPELLNSVAGKVIGNHLDPNAGLRTQMLHAQIAQMEREGKTAAEMSPLRRQLLEAQIAQTQAQTANVGVKERMRQEMLRGLGIIPGGAPQTAPTMPQGGVLPQSGPGGVMPGGVTPMSMLGEDMADPNLIQVQGAAPIQPAQPSVQQVIQGMSPAQRAQLGLSAAGMPEVGKVIGEAADRGQLAEAARNEVDKKLVGAVDALSRMQEIKRQFKPEYLTYDEKFKQYGISWLDSFEATRKKLSPEELQRHAEYTEFRRSAVSNMNLYIKEITGAQMSEAEAVRLRKAIADAEKDGPTAFQAKLNGAIRESQLAIARYKWLRNTRGFTPRNDGNDGDRAAGMLPLPRFQRMIEDDTRKLFNQLRQANPGADQRQIRGAVRQQIRTKYGIDA